MLADAIRSEAFRLGKNRMTMFWSVGFIPLLFAVGGVIYHLVTKSRTAEMATKLNLPATMGQDPVNLASDLMSGAGAAANGAILVFMLVAAATLYAGDYRWETWRLITARNSRVNLVLGKLITFILLALVAMALFMFAGILFGISQAIVFDRPLSFGLETGDPGKIGLLIGLSWVRIVQYAMVALLTAAITRSLLATLFVPVVLGFAQTLIGGPGLALLGWETTDWAAQLTLPGLAFDTLKAAIMADPAAPAAPDGLLAKSAVSLGLWTFVPLALALAWFQRQDLSKE
ncbi:MAG: hypothetical protein DCF28_07435 [Alphaproteobacteria bacterium]|nr:MAG: hypothetical protein DCF28_07435 [Alphaproteobacteria bacterium]PZO33482.1 MAG: hypothetical protein DCE92_12950 [Alphaproteobacteria bacterium]